MARDVGGTCGRELLGGGAIGSRFKRERNG
jgi:hypothetical protein